MTKLDVRCPDCRDIGCECPRGYVNTQLGCETCKSEFIVMHAVCADLQVQCPYCKCTVEVGDDDD